MLEDNTDKIEVGLDMNNIVGEVTLEETGGAMVDKIVEESTGVAIEMIVMTEAGTGLEIGHFPETMATILDVKVQAIVGPGQHPEQVQIRIEFNVISVGNMIISQGTVPLLEMKKKWNSSNKCLLWEMSKPH